MSDRAQHPVRICFWWPSSFLLEDVLRSRLQALPLTVTRVVWARWAHLHSNWFRNTTGGNSLSWTVFFSNFPAMWYGIIPPMLQVLCQTTWLTGRSLVHKVPEGQRSTERVWFIYRWYGSKPHGASGLLIGPRHRNRHVTCGKYRIQPNGPRGMAEYQPETPPEGRQARGRRRGLVSSHTARTIGLYPTYHHLAWKGMFLWSVDELAHRMANSEEL